MKKIGIMLCKLTLRSDNFSNKYDICPGMMPDIPLNYKTLQQYYRQFDTGPRCFNGIREGDFYKLPYFAQGQNIPDTICEKYHDKSIGCYLHLYPLNSVDWLHMHVQVNSLMSYKGLAEDYKNLSVGVIFKFFNLFNITPRSNAANCLINLFFHCLNRFIRINC